MSGTGWQACLTCIGTGQVADRRGLVFDRRQNPDRRRSDDAATGNLYTHLTRLHELTSESPAALAGARAGGDVAWARKLGLLHGHLLGYIDAVERAQPALAAEVREAAAPILEELVREWRAGQVGASPVP
jgi:hypothetical protein